MVFSRHYILIYKVVVLHLQVAVDKEQPFRACLMGEEVSDGRASEVAPKAQIPNAFKLSNCVVGGHEATVG